MKEIMLLGRHLSDCCNIPSISLIDPATGVQREETKPKGGQHHLRTRAQDVPAR